MAEAILVVRTPPGRVAQGVELRLGTYVVLFLYDLTPPILDDDRVKVAPTPFVELVNTVGQTWVDRYIRAEEVTAFDAGDAAWEFVAGQRDVVRDVEDGPLRLETTPEMIARLKLEFAAHRAVALADWAAEYEFTGRRIVP